jgi:hypothetical protein
VIKLESVDHVKRGRVPDFVSQKMEQNGESCLVENQMMELVI